MQNETIEQRAERIVRQEVFLNVSHVVSALAGGDYAHGADPLGELMDQAAELAAPLDDWEEAAIQAGWSRNVARITGNVTYFHKDKPRVHSMWESWQELCEDNEIEPYEREVFEHWAVSDWLANKLLERGEKVDKDFASWNVWARTTTGQGIACDHVIQEIAKAVLA